MTENTETGMPGVCGKKNWMFLPLKKEAVNRKCRTTDTHQHLQRLKLNIYET
jgi:hypothetical protein